MTSTAPIGVFDSGLGGISVVRQIVQDMPHERVLYFGDSANAPYGTKTPQEVRRLSFDIMERFMSQGVKAVVIACNTATSAAAETLRREFPEIPIIGTEPALKPAVERHPGGRILVMATAMTLNEKKFDDLRRHFLREAEIHSVACSGLMEFVERGELSGAALDGYLHEKLTPYLDAPIDAIVLGCTHYPFLSDAIRLTAGPGIRLIDPAPAVARQLKRRLDEPGLLNDTKKAPARIFCTTDANEARERILRLLWTDNAVLQKLDGSVRP